MRARIVPWLAGAGAAAAMAAAAAAEAGGLVNHDAPQGGRLAPRGGAKGEGQARRGKAFHGSASLARGAGARGIPRGGCPDPPRHVRLERRLARRGYFVSSRPSIASPNALPIW